MSSNTSRQPAGIPSGGQFAATAHAEPSATLTPPAARPDQEWHDAAAALVGGGRTPEGARGAVTLALATHLNTTYLETGKAALAGGHETPAALFVLAHSAMQDLPRKIYDAGEDQAAARAAVTDARDRLRRTGSMLDRMHPSGRQPVFRNADDALERFEAFLSPDTEGQP